MAEMLATGGIPTGGAVIGSLLGTASGFTQDLGGSLATDWIKERLKATGGRDVLANHDLERAVGDALAVLVEVHADGLPKGPQREALATFAGRAREAWVAQAVPPLDEDDLTALLADLTAGDHEGLLSAEAWRVELDRMLLTALSGPERNRVGGGVRDALAARLHGEMGAALREVLKADAATGGAAYSGMVLRMLGEILAATRASGDADPEVAATIAGAISGLEAPLAADLAALSEAGAERHRETLERLGALSAEIRRDHERMHAENLAGHERTVRELGGKMDRLGALVEGQIVRAQAAPREPVALGRPEGLFVGRGAEMAAALAALATHRLVVVCGGGGMGKSTFARHLAYEAQGAPWARDGVDAMDLKDQTTADGVIGAIAARTGLADPPREALGLLDQLAVRGRRLYVFDDLHQAMVGDEDGTRALLAALADHDGGFRVLVTCRRQPTAGHPFPLGTLDAEASRELFRSVAADVRYVWNDGDAARLDALLDDLDGYPLAIELAATLLGPLGSLERLVAQWRTHRTDLLRRMGATADKDLNLTVSLGLSYDALASAPNAEAARALLGVLADLPAGATPDLLLAVMGVEGIDAAETVRRRGLAVRDGERVRLLIPVRHFADRRRTRAAEALRPAVETYLLDLAAASMARERWIRDAGTFLRLMEAELPNVEAALDRAEARGDDQFLALMVQHVRRVLAWNSGREESARWLDRARVAARAVGDEQAWADCTFSRGEVARVRNDYDAAGGHYRDAREAYREVGDRLGEAYAVKGLGEVARMRGDGAAAEGHYRDAREAFRQVGDRLGEAYAVKGLGDVARMRGDYDAALDWYRDALQRYAEIEDVYSQSWTQYSIGYAFDGLGRKAEALHAFREAEAGFAALKVDGPSNLAWIIARLASEVGSG